MGFFNFPYFSEEEGNLRETFFFSSFSKFRIHGSPFIMFAGSGCFQIGCSAILQVTDEPEPDLGMSSFIESGFSENVSNLAGDFRVFFCFGSKKGILYMSLGFTGIGSTQIFFGLCAGNFFHFFNKVIVVHNSPPFKIAGITADIRKNLPYKLSINSLSIKVKSVKLIAYLHFQKNIKGNLLFFGMGYRKIF